MTLLTDLPAELLVQIYKAGTNANEQEQVNRLNSLTKTSRALRRVLKPELRRKAFYALIQNSGQGDGCKLTLTYIHRPDYCFPIQSLR